MGFDESICAGGDGAWRMGAAPPSSHRTTMYTIETPKWHCRINVQETPSFLVANQLRETYAPITQNTITRLGYQALILPSTSDPATCHISARVRA